MYRADEVMNGRTDRWSRSIGPQPQERGPSNCDTTNNLTLSTHYVLNRVGFEGILELHKECINIIIILYTCIILLVSNIIDLTLRKLCRS